MRESGILLFLLLFFGSDLNVFTCDRYRKLYTEKPDFLNVLSDASGIKLNRTSLSTLLSTYQMTGKK
jgi:hypothetical protein